MLVQSTNSFRCFSSLRPAFLEMLIMFCPYATNPPNPHQLLFSCTSHPYYWTHCPPWRKQDLDESVMYTACLKLWFFGKLKQSLFVWKPVWSVSTVIIFLSTMNAWSMWSWKSCSLITLWHCDICWLQCCCDKLTMSIRSSAFTGNHLWHICRGLKRPVLKKQTDFNVAGWHVCIDGLSTIDRKILHNAVMQTQKLENFLKLRDKFVRTNLGAEYGHRLCILLAACYFLLAFL